MKVGKKLVEVTLNQLDKTSKITATILKSDKKDIINEKKTYESFWIC
jgi:CMP-N-acetylneuraminic acid synthetase